MHSRRALAVLLAVWVGVSVAFARGARAHGGVVETPPVPVALVAVGAAVAVAATALALAVGPDPPTGRVTVLSLPRNAVVWGRRLVRVLVVVALLAAVASTTGGAGVPFAVAFLWPVLLKGSLVVAAVVGSPWRVLSPWETAYDAVASLEGEDVSLWSYPEWLGSWPAVVGLLAMVGVIENLTVVPASAPLAVAAFATYALLAFLGAVAFGRECFERADAFTVLYHLVGRVAPVAVEPAGGRATVVVRPPWTASARPLDDRGLGAFVVVALATVTFDGAAETVLVASARQSVAGLVGPFAGIAVYVGFLLAFLAGAVVTGRAVAWAADGDSGRQRTGSVAAPRVVGSAVGGRLAATLLPIAVAYDVAHNYAYVLVNATRATEAAIAAAGATVSLDPGPLLVPAGVWGLQVALVIAGHVVAVVAAHVATTRAFPDRATARRGHAPLAALMVAYTVASLYVLAAP